MHFFNSRLKPFFEIRNNRAQFNRLNLSNRLHNVFNRDALEGRLNLQVQVFARNFRKEASSNV